MNKYILVFLYSLVMLTAASPLWADEPPVTLQGILYEENHPDQSVAIIEGDIYRIGGVVNSYTITEIQKDRIVIEDQNSTAYKVTMMGSAKKHSPPQPSRPAAERKEQDKPAQKNKVKEFGFGAPAAFQKLFDLKIILELKKIFSMAQIYYAEKGSLPSLNDLVKTQGLDPEFEDGIKFDYRFTLTAIQGQPAVYADSLDSSKKKRHYLLDPWGNMRYEEGRQATLKSPIL